MERLASGFPRHPLLSNVYVIEITTPRAPRLTRTRMVIRDSVQSNAGLLKVHILGVFKQLAYYYVTVILYFVLCVLLSCNLAVGR